MLSKIIEIGRKPTYFAGVNGDIARGNWGFLGVGERGKRDAPYVKFRKSHPPSHIYVCCNLGMKDKYETQWQINTFIH